MTTVLPLGVIHTGEGPCFALMAILPDGLVEVKVESSWAEAAQGLASRLSQPVTCDPALTTMARRHGWAVAPPEEAALKVRATVALSMQLELPPAWMTEIEAFIAAWREFYPLRLWESLPAEAALPLVRLREGERSEHFVSVLGQAKVEFGLAMYLRRQDFDELFSGAAPQGVLLSVLADEDDDLLRTAFSALGVAAPIISAADGMRPRSPTLDELQLTTAAMQLLTGVAAGQTRTALGPDDTLEFERNAMPVPVARKRAKKAKKAAPKAKKPAPKTKKAAPKPKKVARRR